jgi:hypothetical protein
MKPIFTSMVLEINRIRFWGNENPRVIHQGELQILKFTISCSVKIERIIALAISSFKAKVRLDQKS